MTEPRRPDSAKARSPADDPAAAPSGALVCAPDEVVVLPAPPFADHPAGLRWEQIAGPEAEPDDRTARSPAVRVPPALVNTRLVFEVRPAAMDERVYVVTLWVGPDSGSPAAEAGSTQVVPEGEVVLLDGRGTRLPTGTDARDVGWEWVQVAGPPVALSDPWSQAPAFRAPEGLVSSDVRLELRVTHGADDGTSSVSSVNVLVCGAEASLAVESTTPPVAAAGDLVTLTAAAEVGPGEAVGWHWRQTAGPPVVLDDVRAARPRFQTPPTWRNVRLAFEGTAHDGTRVGSATVALLVEPDECAPLIDAGPSRTVADGDLVHLSPAFSGAGASDWAVRWIQLDGPPVLLRTGRDASLSFLAPDVAATEMLLACVATDGTAHAACTVGVRVEGDEDAPRVDAGPPAVVAPGESVELVGRAYSVDGRPPRVLWRQLRGPRVALSDTTTAHTRFTAPGTPQDTGSLRAVLVFALHAFHGGLESVATVTVRVGSQDPLAESHAGTAREVRPGEEVRLGSWRADTLATIEACAWRQVAGPPVVLSDENAPTAWFRAPQGFANTTLSFELDLVAAGRRTLDTVDVTIEPDEDAPTAHVAADRKARPRELVRLAAFARDPEGLALRKRWRQVAGPPVTLDDPSSTRPTFAAPVLAYAESLVFEFVVSDGVATVVETARVEVEAVGVGDVRPLATGPPDTLPRIKRAG